MAGARRVVSTRDKKKAMEQALFELGRATGLLLKASQMTLACRLAEVAEDLREILIEQKK